MLRYSRRSPEIWTNSTGDDFEQRQLSGDEPKYMFRHADATALMSRSCQGLWKICTNTVTI